MNQGYSTLPESFRQVFSEVLSESEAIGLESDVLLRLLLQPLVSDNFKDAEEKINRRMAHLRIACRKNAGRIMRLLMKLSDKLGASN
jgi:hypothetical protein